MYKRQGHLDEARSDLTDLPDIAGGALDLRAGEGLHRVDDDEIGPARLDPVSYTHLTLPTSDLG